MPPANVLHDAMTRFLSNSPWKAIAASLVLVMTGCETVPVPPTNTERPLPKPPVTHCENISSRAFPTLGKVERLDAALDALIAPDARIEMLAGPGTKCAMPDGLTQTLAQGFDWSEGPVWVEYGRFLLFSDVPRNRIYKWSQSDGLSLFLEPSGYTGKTPRTGEPGSNGLLLDPQGRLVLCQHGDRRMARLGISMRNPKPIYEPLATTFDGKRFNSPNDACYSQNGDLYFTDPPYGLERRMDDPAKELRHQGVYKLSKSHLAKAGQGAVQLLTAEIAYPNGIALSPDDRTLYVAESGPDTRIWAFAISEDGALAGKRVFFDPAPLRKAGIAGGHDGLKVDLHGNLFATGPGGVLVISPAGKHLGTINTGERIANCAWGNDGCTLYLTSDMYLCRIRTKTKGKGFEP